MPWHRIASENAKRAQPQDLTRTMWGALGSCAKDADGVHFTGAGSLPSAFAVTDFAAAAVATAGLAAAEWLALAHPQVATIEVDRRLSSIWFATTLRPIGWSVPPLRDPITGDYATRDGWIRIHVNVPRHRTAMERVLGLLAHHGAVAQAVACWSGCELETAIVEVGGCAAQMRSKTEWDAHPQGAAVAAEPLVHVAIGAASKAPDWPISLHRPLEGIRVLDLTRVLAGPVARRFLAGLGATVLRIDAPDWDEPGAVPETTLGKRCARLDLTKPAERAVFIDLLTRADVFIHGLRPGALEALGFDAATRGQLSPGLIDVSLDAYGWTGPWAERRGFDSLVQMSSGIADAGMQWKKATTPTPLPVQALDHATGYWMAAAAMCGLTRRVKYDEATTWRLSLMGSAKVLMECDSLQGDAILVSESDADHSPQIEHTAWGDAHRVIGPIRIASVNLCWDIPAGKLGAAAPCWPYSA
jgi:hypothetical protein